MKEWCRRARDSGWAYVVIFFAAHALWTCLEVVYYGEVQPRQVDNVMGTIMMFSLFKNFDNWVERMCSDE